MRCDILIIGGGAAALRAALAAYEKDNSLKIVIAVKGKLGKCGTTALAYSDRMAFHATLPTTPPFDRNNWKYHAMDIYEIGGCVSDYNLAEILAKNSAEAFEYLDKLGVPFAKKDGVPVQFVTDGSIYPRACYTGPDTAVQIERALLKKVYEIPNIQILEDTMITDILVSDKVEGAIGLSKDILFIEAKAIVVATGGAGSIYKVNVFPARMTGDGYAMALRAGCELVNMEFIQIGLSSVKTNLACSGSIMRCIPRFINSNGEEFLNKDNITFEDIFNKGATWPISIEHKTCLIDIAVFREISKGKKVYLDFSNNPINFNFDDLPNEIKERYDSEIKEYSNNRKTPFSRLKEINPQTISWFKERGIDLSKDLLELAPAIQHFQGGIKIDKDAKSNIEGLFACGECAGGQHGANRPGGNALLDTQVFGKIAGECAAIYANQATYSNKVNLLAKDKQREYDKYNDEQGIELKYLSNELKETMSTFASVIRFEEGLNKALDTIERLKSTKIKHDKLSEIIEFKNMLLTAEAVVKTCMQRKESRGPHLYFEQFESQPLKRDSKYDVYFVAQINKENNRVEIYPKIPIRPQGDD